MNQEKEMTNYGSNICLKVKEEDDCMSLEGLDVSLEHIINAVTDDDDNDDDDDDADDSIFPDASSSDLLPIVLKTRPCASSLTVSCKKDNVQEEELIIEETEYDENLLRSALASFDDVDDDVDDDDVMKDNDEDDVDDIFEDAIDPFEDVSFMRCLFQQDDEKQMIFQEPEKQQFTYCYEKKSQVLVDEIAMMNNDQAAACPKMMDGLSFDEIWAAKLAHLSESMKRTESSRNNIICLREMLLTAKKQEKLRIQVELQEQEQKHEELRRLLQEQEQTNQQYSFLGQGTSSQSNLSGYESITAQSMMTFAKQGRKLQGLMSSMTPNLL